MGRPATIQHQTIVDAARDVFLRRGFGATTAEVAEQAGVSEGSLFKRFRSKFELFEAAMGGELRDPGFLALLERQVGEGDLRENLGEVAHAMIEFFRRHMPLLMMAWSNPGPTGVPSFPGGGEPPPLAALRRIGRFFAAETAAGRMGGRDPEILARVFVGPLVHFVLVETLARALHQKTVSETKFVRELVDLIVDAATIEPTRPKPKTTPRRRRSRRGAP